MFCDVVEDKSCTIDCEMADEIEQCEIKYEDSDVKSEQGMKNNCHY